MTNIKSIKLDFEQRQQAEGLIGWAHMDPGKAAARIVWQEGRIRELESTAQELLEALDNLLSACQLPGDHCEIEQSIPVAIAAIAKAKGAS